MEGKFKDLLNRSFTNLNNEDEKTIFQWTAKILYATRYKELSILVNRANPEIGKIITPKELESYSALHLFLQSIRYPTTFNEPKPWSIFIFSCEDDQFFYHNNINALCLSMKFGKTSLTIVFEDNNIISDYMSPLKDLHSVHINFPQYLEINAYIFYSGMIKQNVPQYLTNFNLDDETMTIDTIGSLRSRKWIDEEFAAVLDFILGSCGINIGKSTLHPDGLVTTFLLDRDGQHLLKKHFRNKDLR
jgi:hypothetical protein